MVERARREEDTTVVESRGARRQGGKYKTAPPARVSTVVVERTRRTRRFFERKLQALLDCFFTYYFRFFIFISSSHRLERSLVIVTSCYAWSCVIGKKVGKKHQSCSTKKTREAYPGKKKREKPAKEYEIKEIREDAIVRTTEKEFVSVFVTYIVVCPIFILLFFTLLSFIRARSVARRNQPVFSASVCLPQSISGS